MQGTCVDDLITTRSETRRAFIEFAMVKNQRCAPFIDQAKVLKRSAEQAQSPQDLLEMSQIERPLLVAAGISDKAINYFDEEAKREALKKLIEDFLVPAGAEFVEELVFRFLLIKGDALGGSMRNVIGALAVKKLIRRFLSVLKTWDTEFHILKKSASKWCSAPENDYGIENDVEALAWTNEHGPRVFALNRTIPPVSKNIDLCLFNCAYGKYLNPNTVRDMSVPIMLGELKGGIDPAGADEHWKTARTALERIRETYAEREDPILTAFIGAAIETSMAEEICTMLNEGKLNFAANLTKDIQLTSFCEWTLAL